MPTTAMTSWPLARPWSPTAEWIVPRVACKTFAAKAATPAHLSRGREASLWWTLMTATMNWPLVPHWSAMAAWIAQRAELKTSVAKAATLAQQIGRKDQMMSRLSILMTAMTSWLPAQPLLTTVAWTAQRVALRSFARNHARLAKMILKMIETRQKGLQNNRLPEFELQ